MVVDYLSVGIRIKKARMKCNISQEELAYRIQKNRAYISYVETGRRIPSLETLVCIANTLEVSMDELLADSLVAIAASEDKLDYYLLDCTPKETAFLCDALIALKDVLRKNNI